MFFLSKKSNMQKVVRAPGFEPATFGVPPCVLPIRTQKVESSNHRSKPTFLHIWFFDKKHVYPRKNTWKTRFWRNFEKFNITFMVFLTNFFVFSIFGSLKKLFSKFFFCILVELEIWRLFKKKIVQFDKEMVEKNAKYWRPKTF